MPMSEVVTTGSKQSNLIWLDMEMSGLDLNKEVILEIAVIVTDSNLNILVESPSYAVFQPDSILDAMDKWNQNAHTKSGLIERVKSSTYDIQYVERKVLHLLKKYVAKHASPLCGNSIHQDRKFLAKYMPELEAFFHYRHIDVSTLKELAKRWYPDIATGFKKHNRHEALADVQESINELKYYREKIFVSLSEPIQSADILR